MPGIFPVPQRSYPISTEEGEINFSLSNAFQENCLPFMQPFGRVTSGGAGAPGITTWLIMKDYASTRRRAVIWKSGSEEFSLAA